MKHYIYLLNSVVYSNTDNFLPPEALHIGDCTLDAQQSIQDVLQLMQAAIDTELYALSNRLAEANLDEQMTTFLSNREMSDKDWN